MKDLLGKRVLVTGGSRGIGAAIALTLARNGADVAISYKGAADRAQDVVDQIDREGQHGVAPAALRRIGTKRLETWLRNRKVTRADRLAETAVQTAERQHTSLPGGELTAQLVHTLAKEVMTLNQQVAEVDKLIEARFRDHHTFDVITSMPGLGIILGAEFLAATGGDMTAFGTPDRLAGFGGVAPVPRDSGKISGNLRRPQRYNRRLQRVFYASALFSIRYCEDSRRFYERKRAEGKRHTQAVLALARRRVNVLWALLRDGRCYQQTPPIARAA